MTRGEQAVQEQYKKTVHSYMHGKTDRTMELQEAIDKVEQQTQRLQQQQQNAKLGIRITDLSQQLHHLEAELQQLTAMLTESKQANVLACAKAAAAATSSAADLQAAQERHATIKPQAFNMNRQQMVNSSSKVSGRMDDMLLISLGITQPLDNVTMLVCLWVATKLEGHRRQVAGCSKLGAALQLPVWSVTSVELHLMQLLGWQPYSGWALRPSDTPSCQVLEV
eukprot:gene2916-3203_t